MLIEKPIQDAFSHSFKTVLYTKTIVKVYETKIKIGFEYGTELPV